MATTTTPTDERRTLTVDEAARELGIGRTLAFQMARTGELPVIRLGRRVLVPRAALERMLADPPRSARMPQDV